MELDEANTSDKVRRPAAPGRAACRLLLGFRNSHTLGKAVESCEKFDRMTRFAEDVRLFLLSLTLERTRCAWGVWVLFLGITAGLRTRSGLTAGV